MASHGWSPSDVDEWEVWQVARFLGQGLTDGRPVISGVRQLRYVESDVPTASPPAGDFSPLDAAGWGMSTGDLDLL